MIPQVIEVPSPLGLRPSGLEDAPDALRRAALHQRLGSPDAVRIDVPPYDDVRDPETGILNPHGITAVARDVASAVAATLDAGRFPVLLGGDCSIVLGPLLALRRRGRYGLAFLDGHADFRIPATSRMVRSHRSTWRWQRDAVLICSPTSMGCGRWSGTRTSRSSATGSLTITTISSASTSGAPPSPSLTSREVRKTGTGRVLERTLATVTKPDLKGFWVHLDVDVLDDALMPAVDYRHPGGLTWQEAEQILAGLLASDRACGLEVTIFNPRLDPGGGIAQRLSDLITNTVPRPAGDAGPDRLRHR